MSDIGSRVRELRKAAGWSQQALADKLGLRQATVSDWELGKAAPTRGNLRLVSDLFVESLEVYHWLQDGSGPPPTMRTPDRAPKIGRGDVRRPIPRFPQGPASVTEATVGELCDDYASWVREVVGYAALSPTVPSEYLLEIGVLLLRTCEMLRDWQDTVVEKGKQAQRRARGSSE